MGSHIILKYKYGMIRGRPYMFADALLVKKGEPLQVIHQNDALADLQYHLRKRLEGK
jgi:hypothetical protein